MKKKDEQKILNEAIDREIKAEVKDFIPEKKEEIFVLHS